MRDPVAGIDIRVNTPGNDTNRTDDTITFEAFTGSTGRGEEQTTIDVMVADVHMLPGADAISAAAKDDKEYADGSTITSVAEGGTAYIWVTVENTIKDQVADDEKFSVSLSAAEASQLLDFRVSPSSITVPARDDFTLGSDDSERVGPFTLEALMDEDIGAETLMLSIDLVSAQPELSRGSGSSSGSFSIDIEDASKPMVWAKSRRGCPGGGRRGEGGRPHLRGRLLRDHDGRPVRHGRGRHGRLLGHSGRLGGVGGGQRQRGHGHGRRGGDGQRHGHRHRDDVGCQVAPADRCRTSPRSCSRSMSRPCRSRSA